METWSEAMMARDNLSRLSDTLVYNMLTVVLVTMATIWLVVVVGSYVNVKERETRHDVTKAPRRRHNIV